MPKKPPDSETTHVGTSNASQAAGDEVTRAADSAGDFNTPKLEQPDGQIETWGGNPGAGNRWDAGERQVLEGLAEHDLQDVFRLQHGYRKRSFSIVVRGMSRRYDHVFASKSLRAKAAEYLHQYRAAKLSDHAPLLITFDSGR